MIQPTLNGAVRFQSDSLFIRIHNISSALICQLVTYISERGHVCMCSNWKHAWHCTWREHPVCLRTVDACVFNVFSLC